MLTRTVFRSSTSQLPRIFMGQFSLRKKLLHNCCAVVATRRRLTRFFWLAHHNTQNYKGGTCCRHFEVREDFKIVWLWSALYLSCIILDKLIKCSILANKSVFEIDRKFKCPPFLYFTDSIGQTVNNLGVAAVFSPQLDPLPPPLPTVPPPPLHGASPQHPPFRIQFEYLQSLTIGSEYIV